MMLICIIDYCVPTPKRGLVLKPHSDWDGISTDYEFEVTVKTDSNYAKCLDTRRSMTGSVVYMNGVPVICRSSSQKMMSFSTTEAELNAAVMGVQDASFIKNILTLLGLKVKLSILASIVDCTAVDIGNNSIVGGRIHHMEVKQNFL